MEQLHTYLLVLDQAEAEGLAALGATKAIDLPGAIAKLMVAARLFRDEDDEHHRFVVEAIADLATLEVALPLASGSTTAAE